VHPAACEQRWSGTDRPASAPDRLQRHGQPMHCGPLAGQVPDQGPQLDPIAWSMSSVQWMRGATPDGTYLVQFENCRNEQRFRSVSTSGIAGDHGLRKPGPCACALPDHLSLSADRWAISGLATCAKDWSIFDCVVEAVTTRSDLHGPA
jgi:hypothetical protein